MREDAIIRLIRYLSETREKRTGAYLACARVDISYQRWRAAHQVEKIRYRYIGKIHSKWSTTGSIVLSGEDATYTTFICPGHICLVTYFIDISRDFTKYYSADSVELGRCHTNNVYLPRVYLNSHTLH